MITKNQDVFLNLDNFSVSFLNIKEDFLKDIYNVLYSPFLGDLFKSDDEIYRETLMEYIQKRDSNVLKNYGQKIKFKTFLKGFIKTDLWKALRILGENSFDTVINSINKLDGFLVNREKYGAPQINQDDNVLTERLTNILATYFNILGSDFFTEVFNREIYSKKVSGNKIKDLVKELKKEIDKQQQQGKQQQQQGKQQGKQQQQDQKQDSQQQDKQQGKQQDKQDQNKQNQDKQDQQQDQDKQQGKNQQQDQENDIDEDNSDDMDNDNNENDNPQDFDDLENYQDSSNASKIESQERIRQLKVKLQEEIGYLTNLISENFEIVNLVSELELFSTFNKNKEKIESRIPENITIKNNRNLLDIKEVLPREFLYEDEVFYLKAIKNELLIKQYEEEKGKKIVLYILLDVSGSMVGTIKDKTKNRLIPKYVMSHALILSLLKKIYEGEELILLLQDFDNKPKNITIIDNKEKALDIAGRFLSKVARYNGGTYIKQALEVSFKNISKNTLNTELYQKDIEDKSGYMKQAHFFMITDGEDVINNYYLIKKFKSGILEKRNFFKAFLFLITDGWSRDGIKKDQELNTILKYIPINLSKGFTTQSVEIMNKMLNE